MRTSPGPVKTKIQCDSEDMYVDDAFRTLVGLIEKSSAAAPSHSGGENVLVDTEVEGARYLLVRMPGRGRAGSTESPRTGNRAHGRERAPKQSDCRCFEYQRLDRLHPHAANLCKTRRRLAGSNDRAAPRTGNPEPALPDGTVVRAYLDPTIKTLLLTLAGDLRMVIRATGCFPKRIWRYSRNIGSACVQ